MLSRFPRRLERAAFVTMGLAAATLLVVVTDGSLRAIGRTFPGFAVWDDLVVAPVGRPQWTGMAAEVPVRSIVTTIDGRRVTDRVSLARVVAAAPAGTTHAYGFRDRGGLQRREVASMRFGVADWLSTLGVSLWNGMVFLLTGLIVFYLKPEAPQSRAVVIAAFVWGTTLVLGVDLIAVGRIDRLYFVFEALSVAAGIQLALRFPENRRPRSGPLGALYLVAFGVGLVEGASFHRSPDVLLALNHVVRLSLVASCAAAVAAVAVGATGAAAPLVKRRARVVLAGILIAVAVPLLPMLAFALFGQPMWLGPLALTGFVYPLALGYAVVRHDLFEADRLVAQSIVYAALVAVVSLAYAGLVLAAHRLALGRVLDDYAAVPVTFVLVMLLTLLPLRERVRRALERRLGRSSAERNEAVAGLSERLAPLLETRQIVEQVEVTLRYVLGVERIGVWERDGVDLVRRDRAGRGAIPAGDSGLTALATTGRLVSRDEVEESPSFRTQRDALCALFEALDALLVVPLGRPGKLTGLLAIGPTLSGRPLSADDVEVLRTVADVTGSALEKARAVARLRSAREPHPEAQPLSGPGQ